MLGDHVAHCPFNNLPFVVSTTPHALSQTGPLETVAPWIARRIAELAQQAVAERGTFSLVIPGGSVAAAVIPYLRSAPVPWRHTHLFWADERDVAPDDPASNSGEACRRWAGSPIASQAYLHPMTDGRMSMEHAAVAYDELLHRIVGDALVLDMVLLGVGADGHVASLFPGHAALRVTDRAAVSVPDAPKPPKHRLTMTLPVLSGAREVLVAVFGAEKAAVMQRVLAGDNAVLPVARIIRDARHVRVVLDDQAAHGLPTNSVTPIR